MQQMQPQHQATMDKPLSSAGRFSRLSYLAWTFLSGIVLNAVLVAIVVFFYIAYGVSSGGNFETEPSAGMMIGFGIAYIIILIAYLVYTFIFAIRRLHDCDQTGWLSLLLLVPLVSLFFLLYICIAKGTDGTNRYGVPRPTKEWERVMGIIYLVLIPLMMIVAIGVLSAIAIPAYQDYIERANQSQQQLLEEGRSYY
ncbi:Uncharacterized membrane protein YhaH, DUF805 family [Acinetobacter marinus]|uniref:Uncharacterized membrane protein YhaH, DUF805 family n=1 Tax=Acinetobacter marinus TaxID=281375 RepID=A0A1G6HD88_9GAMM|nr:DUF805 domain-containing protein [Acinetobacter marinus]SDB92114.1 Uncharacterized membrane protein YhaH, DUF805 family [Acinetobacter marinus]